MRSIVAALAALSLVVSFPAYARSPWSRDCALGSELCADVADSDAVFDHYVGHDEPAIGFYSSEPGSGNRIRYRLTLPVEPAAVPPEGVRTFQLASIFWFGMALCDTQSYPEQVSTCTPVSDANVTPLAQHPGAAFLELQLYAPGWVEFPLGRSCDPTRWCAALTIDSLARDPISNRSLNKRCAKHLHGGVESINFAFVTRDGTPHAPPDPLTGSPGTTTTPNPDRDLFMNPGDTLVVTMQDTPNGVRTDIEDLTTHETGSMTASAANGFAQVRFAPPPSKACAVVPYDFHPMYDTSTEDTTVPWLAHSLAVSFAGEIGHFQYITAANSRTARGKGREGANGDGGAADRDDLGCFTSPPAPFVAGCFGANSGFDGPSYEALWPDGDPHRPTPIIVASPVTGAGFTIAYESVGFETDLPTLEALHGRRRVTRASARYCDLNTGANCSLIPRTDRGTPAAFYPFFSRGTAPGGECAWTIGDDVPGFTVDDFGRNAQYGAPLPRLFLSRRGVERPVVSVFRQIVPNPCPAAP